ncbi:type II secretion system secretin GspD [Luteibacter sp. 9135]|uniref:type II secretion system secretin GspD n=1 Tax=Luteibacter sp. 9135 TaxID=1500893 RepID=UPI00068AD37D|nr:type II secretion system secretin GspD [Luteibacter sp. 9135]
MKPCTLGMAALSALLMAGCASHSSRLASHALEYEALAGTERPVPAPLPLNEPPEADVTDAAAPSIQPGNGHFIRPQARTVPSPVASGTDAVTFNFEDQPVEAVVKAILGDLLKANYAILPGVRGTVSFSTAQPVTREQALPILETLLSWTGNALVHEQGRYNVLPSTQAVAGHLVPRLKAGAPAAGMSARLFTLRHVAAPEMARLLAPFVLPEAVLLADPARPVLVLAGTPDELANYQATIDTFDVDWVAGMSVGVFSLKHATVGELLPALESVFGKDSGGPVAGLIRFLPVERTGSIVVIGTQESHVSQVGEWIARIDGGGGNEPRLFVYDLRNLPATDVARYIGSVFDASVGGDQGGRVMPGPESESLGSTEATTDAGGIGAGFGDRDMAEDPTFFQSAAPSLSGSGRSTGASTIRVTAIDANNQLMIRARPSEWAEVRKAIERLDAVPLQVQIETRILEVQLRDAFRFGVQWYLEGLAGGNGGVAQPGNKQQWALGGGIGAVPTGRPDTLFYSFVNSELQVALRAMEHNGHTKILSAPSLVVVNNHKARIQVGDQIPVTQTYVNTNVGSGNPVGQVEYKDTGVILDVRPRVNPGGLVYLDVIQEVSRAGSDTNATNLPIMKRKLTTQVAVQSGQTVLLGGLIRELDTENRSGVPGLSRVPLLGALFRNQDNGGMRTELVVLITPRVIANGVEAKRVLDDYRRSFRSLRPLERVASDTTTTSPLEEG